VTRGIGNPGGGCPQLQYVVIFGQNRSALLYTDILEQTGRGRIEKNVCHAESIV
jgi:hypothetical protein